MGLIQRMKNQQTMTERERDICNYILEHPEKVESISGFPLDKFWIYLSVPIGAALMLIQYFLNLIVLFFEKKGGAAES